MWFRYIESTFEIFQLEKRTPQTIIIQQESLQEIRQVNISRWHGTVTILIKKCLYCGSLVYPLAQVNAGKCDLRPPAAYHLSQ